MSAKDDKLYRDYLKTLPPSAPGAKAQPKNTLIHPAPDRNGKRASPRRVSQPKTPPAPKRSKSTPGAQQQPRTGRTYPGRGRAG